MKNIAHPILLALAYGVCVADVRAAGDASREAAIRGLTEAPLCFEANRGQAGSAAPFIARGKDCTVFISPTEASLLASRFGRLQTVRLALQGANAAAQISGVDELAGRANYFIGSEADQWQSSVPLFARVRAAQVYPGIDVVYYADQSVRLEYDFLLQPGADPKQISLRVSGADKVRVDQSGELVLKIGGDEIRQQKPVIYQTVNGARKEIAGGYTLTGKTTAGFWLGDYDHSQPLVIDPVILTYSSYLGGRYGDHGWDIATDASGNVYVCGDTLTPNLVSGKTAQFQTKYGGTAGSMQYGDAFVAKFVPDSSNVLSLAYLTYLGGRGQDSARGIAADAAGNAYVTGFTDSPNFPTLNPAFKKISGPNNNPLGIYRTDAFVSKLGPQGTNLIYSTYLGGGGRDAGNAIAVDNLGYAYVTGFTESTDFPIVTNRAASASRVVQRSFGGVQDIFVAKIGLAGTNLEYSTYLGGTNQDVAEGIAVDASGNVYLTGYTVSGNFPVVPAKNSYLNGNKLPTGDFDAFFAAISADGATNIFSTYLGGNGSDVGMRLALDVAGSAYLTGYTYSTNYPATGVVTNTRAYTGLTAGGPDVFVTKFSPTNLVAFTNQIILGVTNQVFFTNFIYFTNYSVKFGGSGVDESYGIAVDAAGEACIAGWTHATNFFGTNSFFDLRSTNKISSTTAKAFVALLNPDATAFNFAALLGGAGSDAAHGVALDQAGHAYLIGGTTSSDFPTLHSLGGRPGGKLGNNDVFIAALNLPTVSETSLRKTRQLALAAPPMLQITQSAGAVTLTWSAAQTAYVLESSPGLSPADWQPVSLPPAAGGGLLSVTLPATNREGYFRLRTP